VSDARDLVSRANAIFARLRSGDGPAPADEEDSLADDTDDAAPAATPSSEAVEGDLGQPETDDPGHPDDIDAEAEPSPELSAAVAQAAEASAAATDLAPSPETSPVVDVGAPEETQAPPSVAGALGEQSAVVRPLPRVIAIANQKGGVGKTTTAVNLGAALAELGYRVLVVDLDPQGNATTGLGINARNLQVSVYDVVMSGTPLEDCIEPTAVRNLFVAPSTIDLAGAEIELVPAFSRELKLRRALDAVGDDFEFTLIDCPPSLGLLTVNGLAAAGEVVVPIQCEYYALEGLGQLLKNVSLVQGNLNPRLELGAIVLTIVNMLLRMLVSEVEAR